MNLEPALKNEQIRLKRELKSIGAVINRLTLDEYNERRWRLRNDRPAGLKDKQRMKEVQDKRNALQAKRFRIQAQVWNLGDAICRLREINRGNSKRCVESVFKQLITGSK